MDNELLAVDTEEIALGPLAGFASPATTPPIDKLSHHAPARSQGSRGSRAPAAVD